MNKIILVLCVTVSSLLFSGCKLLEAFGIEIAEVTLDIHNNSSETILYLYSVDDDGELHLLNGWEREDHNIPVGSNIRLLLKKKTDEKLRAESTTMYWEYRYRGRKDKEGDVTLYWFLMDTPSFPL